MKHVPVLLVFSFVPASLVFSQTPDKLKHVADARTLVKNLDLANTAYEHGAGNVKFTGTVECYADCSGFVDHLLKHSYGYDASQFKKWLGSTRPTAARYHDAIVSKTGFLHVTEVKDTTVGDFLAVKYLVRKDNTGHIMLVSGAPQKMKPSAPLVADTEQWQVKVIDASKSGHGPTDTRHKKGKDGKDHDGLGEGIFRIYADRQGNVAGFSWSTSSASEFKPPDEEHLVIGRLKVER